MGEGLTQLSRGSLLVCAPRLTRSCTSVPGAALANEAEAADLPASQRLGFREPIGKGQSLPVSTPVATALSRLRMPGWLQ